MERVTVAGSKVLFFAGFYHVWESNLSRGEGICCPCVPPRVCLSSKDKMSGGGHWARYILWDEHSTTTTRKNLRGLQFVTKASSIGSNPGIYAKKKLNYEVHYTIASQFRYRMKANLKNEYFPLKKKQDSVGGRGNLAIRLKDLRDDYSLPSSFFFFFFCSGSFFLPFREDKTEKYAPL